MNDPRAFEIPLRARLVSESEAQRLFEAQQRVREEYAPKSGGWLAEEEKKEAA